MARRISPPRPTFATISAMPLGQRLLIFSSALGLLAVLAGYIAALGLVRIWPAVFPGETLDLGLVNALPGPARREPEPDSAFVQPITTLVIGVDTRPLQLDLEAVRADTLMFASIDPATHTINVLAIPRDLLIEIRLPDGRTYRDRINASFAAGAADGRYESGARQLAADVERNFGVSVDHWVVMDFPAVEAFVNRIGGIDVDVPPDLAVPDWYYSNDDVVGQWVSFPEGRQHLDGYHAVAFGRARLYDDDFHRVRRQQLVLAAVLEKTLARGILNSPMAIWNDYRNVISTNVPASRVPGYALLVKKSGGNLSMYTLADSVAGRPTVFDQWTPAGAEVLGWNPENVAYWFDFVTRHDPAPLPGEAPTP